MGVTYTRAAERDARPRPETGAFLRGPLDLRLAAISLLAILGVFLTAAARLSIVSATGAPVVNLNTVRDARQLEKPLEALFENAGDRRFAAVQLLSFLMAGGERRIVANVGAIGRAQAPVADVRRVRDVWQYAARIQGLDAARSIPLLTAQDVAQLKPSLVVRTRGTFVRTLLWWTLAYVAAFHVVSIWWRRTRGGDRVLLAAAHLLTAIGLCAMIARPDPLRDLLLFTRFAQTVCIGAGVMAIVSALDFRSPQVRHFTYAPLAAAMGLSILLLLFGRGPGASTARVNLGPVQPIEAIRLLLVMFLAGYLARRWELLRQLRQTTFRSRAIPAWLDVPRAEYAVPVVSGVAAALGLLFLQKDLGPALILGLLFLSMYAIARGRLGMPLAGLGLLLLGFYASYRLQIPPTVVDRVRIWQSPWDNGVRGGDQIAHAIWTLASGGPLGAGLGLGATRYLPAGHTDLVLASIGEELGTAGFAVIAALYTAIVLRALRIARAASTDYEFFLAIGAMLLVVGPVLLMASAMVGIAPLTGVVTPFLSYGGSAMTANFAALGILASVRSHATPGRAFEAFHRPVRWLAATLAVAAAVPFATIVTVQVVRADEYAVKPHLGLQADGSRRYEYNPRILDAVRQIPRGSVFDRTGLPLATDDPLVWRKAAAAYQRLGVSLDIACPQASPRCYPLGGLAFHLIGDARSRVNWAASNTSFVERDDESKLRGFDDHAQAIRVSGDGVPESWTIRRDYRPVLPLLRHRYEPDHPAVKAVLDRPRDVRLTIDARLQMKVAGILQSYARLSATGRAAAVVVDAESGDVLASLSYPWPAMTGDGVDVSNQQALLDRARYGLYPPGSTFKLVTAAAALRQNPRAGETRFACVPLGDGRVGARIPGWARPVRDDVKDKRAHGVIDMHAAMTVSCNAYFAQLAVKTGPLAIADAARAINVTLARGNAPDRIRETLPQIGYGQGEVVVAPTKMAQIAAAIATGGRVVDLQIEPEPRDRRSGAWLAPSTARRLASWMRDVVLTGTGHALKDHPVPIAGKTGTAELTGADSHAWFVGFAPYAPAPRHLAFAVLLENAGYGGAAAAPAAGEIVTAAESLGLMGK